MLKFLEYIKAALQLAIGFVVLAFIIFNFQDLGLAVRTLLERASVRSINVLGTDIGFDEPRVSLALRQYEYLSDDDVREVWKLINGLTGEEFDRLMLIGDLKNLCEFEKPLPGLRKYVTLDRELKEKRLTEIKDSPEILKRVQQQQAEDVAHGKSLENGHPLKCYEMTLTNVGWNVKTALIRNVSAAFHAP